MNNFRKINTPFFSKKAYEILNSLHIQFCSELWKKCRVYTKHWVNFKVERRANGQVYFKVNKNYQTNVFGGEKFYDNPFKNMSNAEFLNWIATKLKAVIAAELKTVIVTELKDNSISSREGWKRNNTTFESAYLSYDEIITVADIYAVYDWLKGRKINMSAPAIKDIFGNPRSEDQVKKIEDKQSEIDFIQANRDNLMEEVKERYVKQIENLEKQLAELKSKMEEDLKVVNNDCYMKVKALHEELEKLSV